jgi:O-acetyl-ADP-ribose deacetylase (regulator of RNase III)
MGMPQKYKGREGSNRVVLTALGGGVFENPRKKIIEAVATCKDSIIRESRLQVYFVCFDNTSFRQSMKGGLVKGLGGRIIADESEL